MILGNIFLREDGFGWCYCNLIVPKLCYCLLLIFDCGMTELG